MQYNYQEDKTMTREELDILMENAWGEDEEHLEDMSMSSINTIINLSKYSMNTEVMRFMKKVDAFVNPKDMTVSSYKP